MVPVRLYFFPRGPDGSACSGSRCREFAAITWVKHYNPAKRRTAAGAGNTDPWRQTRGVLLAFDRPGQVVARRKAGRIDPSQFGPCFDPILNDPILNLAFGEHLT